jgi:hypothetical protein
MILQGISKKVIGGGGINESMRKRVFKGDVDKNSIFYDLIMTPMTPRQIGLRLHFFKNIAGGMVSQGVN